MKDTPLRLGLPVRVDLGPYEELDIPDSPATEELGLAEVDRDPAQGWVWLVQREPLPAQRAITLVVRVRRPGEAAPKDRRLIVVGEGGSGGTAG